MGRYGTSLRFPHLLLLTGLLFAADLLIPDGIPFIDEVALGLLTLMFANWRTDPNATPGGPGDDAR